MRDIEILLIIMIMYMKQCYHVVLPKQCSKLLERHVYDLILHHAYAKYDIVIMLSLTLSRGLLEGIGPLLASIKCSNDWLLN